MAKSIKLKDNNYIDSTGVVHNKELLSNILDEMQKPVTLYDNSSGTTGSITLSETSANYEYLEFFYGKNDCVSSTRVVRSSGKATFITYVNLGTTPQFLSKEVSISGKNITHNNGYYLNFTSNGVSTGSTNEIKIYRILGYK